MEQLTSEVYCQRAALELAALVRHQRRPRAQTRHDSPLLRRCVQEVLAARQQGHAESRGPWTVGQRPLKRPGRGGARFIPLAQRGRTTIMLSTLEEAQELVAFLNYCGMDEFSSR